MAAVKLSLSRWSLTIPILAPAILASTALGFIRSLESLEIEMVLGIPARIYVVPTKIWDYIHWGSRTSGKISAGSTGSSAFIHQTPRPSLQTSTP